LRTFVVSDIHGANEAFRSALKHIKFRKTDKLFVLGDLIDRGEDSKGVLDTIILLKEHGFDINCIWGNHEQMLIDSLDDFTSKIGWIKNGGGETLSSFLTSEPTNIPKKYIELILSFEKYAIHNKYILVHAGLNMKIEAPFDDEFALLWSRDWDEYYDKEWLGEKVIIHGHTPLTKNEIKNSINGNIICIDNGSYIPDSNLGSICILNIDTKEMHFEPVKHS